ncbi:MAG TPA: glycine/sarcosine/betaine reductase selenoprotein B family protein, partial [Ktedonobacteraceae bacterium]
GDPTYRVIPLETPLDGLCVKHHLVLVQPGKDGDIGHLFPLRAARQLYEEGMIGELAASHYSFMGYIPYTQPLVELTAPDIAQRLRAEQVDAVILTPA